MLVEKHMSSWKYIKFVFVFSIKVLTEFLWNQKINTIKTPVNVSI